VKFLNSIRMPVKENSMPRQVLNTLLVLSLGMSLGLIAKILDCTASNELPYLIEILDLGNFFSGMAIWILIAVAISVYSNSPIRAGINVFLFYTSMLIGYYTYTKYVAGFFPKSYIIIWAVLTIISPFLAYICWYAKGDGKISLIISSGIVGILFTQAFNFRIFYFYRTQRLEIIVFIVSVVMFYKNPKQLAQMIGLSIIIALIWYEIGPFGYLFRFLYFISGYN
jgi:hypothetical protein